MFYIASYNPIAHVSSLLSSSPYLSIELAEKDIMDLGYNRYKENGFKEIAFVISEPLEDEDVNYYHYIVSQQYYK